jgi:hypothetical protein
VAPSLWALSVATLAVVANTAGQIAAYRLLRSSGRLFKSQLAGTLVGGLVLGLLVNRGPEGALPADVATADALLYAAFCYVYFHWNNMGETARRIRMLRELAAAPEGLTVQEMVRRYSAREILERRLERLSAAGQISETDGRLVLTSRAVLLSAQLVGLVKLIVFGGRSELDGHDHITL